MNAYEAQLRAELQRYKVRSELVDPFTSAWWDIVRYRCRLLGHLADVNSRVRQLLDPMHRDPCGVMATLA